MSRVVARLVAFARSLPRSLAKQQRPIATTTVSHVGSTMADSGGGGDFRLSTSGSSVLKLQKGEITLWSVDGSTDAIVNAANEGMLGVGVGVGHSGSVDGAIHRAAGPELLEACLKVPLIKPGIRCPAGEARITPAFQLPVNHVIHTVGPVYGFHNHPEASLRNAYKNNLKLAKDNNIQYIAFPAISCGAYSYPYKEASKIAISTAKEFSDGIKEHT